MDYLKRQREFFSYCEAKGITHLITEDNLPKNMAPNHDVYKIRLLLNEKFNRNFTDAEIIELLRPLPKKKKKSFDDVSLPQWYVDKWLSKK